MKVDDNLGPAIDDHVKTLGKKSALKFDAEKD